MQLILLLQVRNVVVSGHNTEIGMYDPKNKWGHNIMKMPIEKCAV
jgi:hypothetical protein